MTELEQRLAIHGARGLDVKVCPIHHQVECCGRNIPNYPHDLNAMHDATAKLHYDELPYFVAHCRDIAHRENQPDVLMRAKDYTEAFLKTKGLWKD